MLCDALGAPHAVMVHPATDHLTRSQVSRINGTTGAAGIAGKPETFILRVVDPFGNQVQPRDAILRTRVVVFGPSLNTSLTLKPYDDDRDGEAEVVQGTFLATQVGVYSTQIHVIGGLGLAATYYSSSHPLSSPLSSRIDASVDFSVADGGQPP
eukprot:1572424-Rhodomonas_salina.1